MPRSLLLVALLVAECSQQAASSLACQAPPTHVQFFPFVRPSTLRRSSVSWCLVYSYRSRRRYTLSQLQTSHVVFNVQRDPFAPIRVVTLPPVHRLHSKAQAPRLTSQHLLPPFPRVGLLRPARNHRHHSFINLCPHPFAQSRLPSAPARRPFHLAATGVQRKGSPAILRLCWLRFFALE